MIIDFNQVEESHIDGFKGGKGMMHSRGLFDGKNRIMLNRLEPGACSGYHAHEDNCEMIYVLSGELEFRYDDATEPCRAGQLHYCHQGHSHAFRNTGTTDAVFLAIVPEQRVNP